MTIGYRAPRAAAIAGCTYRQLVYLDQVGILIPYAYESNGCRLYTADDVRTLHVFTCLVDAGVTFGHLVDVRVVDVLRSPWHDWQGWLFVGHDRAEIVTDPGTVNTFAAAGRPFYALNLHHTAHLLDNHPDIEHRSRSHA